MDSLPSSLVSELASAWRLAVRGTLGDADQLSILYSGGLDSSLVAVGAREFADVELVTVGVRGSHDLRSGERGSQVLGLPWTGHTIDRVDLERESRRAGRALTGTTSVSRAVLLGILLALEGTSRPRVLCGQGADELFLGYAHFEGLDARKAETKRAQDLEKLIHVDWPLARTLAERRNKDLRSPYLYPSFLERVWALPVNCFRGTMGRKGLLRAVALEAGVPPELAGLPKKAFQYGSGIDRLLRSMRVDASSS